MIYSEIVASQRHTTKKCRFSFGKNLAGTTRKIYCLRAIEGVKFIGLSKRIDLGNYASPGGALDVKASKGGKAVA